MKIESEKRNVSYTKEVKFKKIVVFTDSDCDSFEVAEASKGNIQLVSPYNDNIFLSFEEALKVSKAINKMVKELKPTVKKKVKK